MTTQPKSLDSFPDSYKDPAGTLLSKDALISPSEAPEKYGKEAGCQDSAFLDMVPIYPALHSPFH